MARRARGGAVALTLTLAACTSAPIGGGRDLVLLCPGDRAVRVSFLRRGAEVLLASGPDQLILPRLPVASGLAYGDGRAALRVANGTALLTVATGRIAVMACHVQAGGAAPAPAMPPQTTRSFNRGGPPA